jgi:hypothetical protein
MNEISNLIDQYYKWLKDNTGLASDQETGWSVINTPFVGLFNDTINVFVKKENSKILLSDDGETLRNLSLEGVDVYRSAKRKDFLDKILLNYGVRITNAKELMIEANIKDFAKKKHNLLSSIIEISDMFFLASHKISSIFKEDVENYLKEQDIVYTQQFIARGYTGIEFAFDFQIAYPKKEIVLKAFNNINTLNIPHFLFAWEDIKTTREKISGKEILGLAVINDERAFKHELLDALNKKNADFILWSDRYKPEIKKKLLAA